MLNYQILNVTTYVLFYTPIHGLLSVTKLIAAVLWRGGTQDSCALGRSGAFCPMTTNLGLAFSSNDSGHS